MVDITCKCICCGKTWKIAVDEHDCERYLLGKQFKNETPQLCRCEGVPVKKFDIPEINTVCEICGEEL